MKKISILLFFVFISACHTTEKTTFHQKKEGFQGVIVYHTINNFSLDPNREFVKMDYDVENIFELNFNSIIEKKYQNPMYLQALDSAIKHYPNQKEVYEKMRVNYEDVVKGYTNTYDLENAVYFHQINGKLNTPQKFDFIKQMPNQKYHKLEVLKGDSIILGYPCKKYQLKKKNGTIDIMWATDRIMAYIPPYYGSLYPSDIQDDEKASSNYIFRTIPQGVCLFIESFEPEKVKGIKSSKIIKVVKINKK